MSGKDDGGVEDEEDDEVARREVKKGGEGREDVSFERGETKGRKVEGEGKLNEPSGVVDDVLDDTSNVTVPLGEIESSKSRGLLPVVGVGLKGGEARREGEVKSQLELPSF